MLPSSPPPSSAVDDIIRIAERLKPRDRLHLIASLLDSLGTSNLDGLTEPELMALRRLIYDHEHRPTQVYSVPRRFDLATIFVVMLAYSLLFGAMKGLSIPPAASAFIAGFILIVGAGQAFLFGGRQPRAASIVIGALLYALAMLAFWIMEGPRVYPTAVILVMASYSIIGGGILGYLSGVLIGGVFLIADKLRNRFSRPHRAEEHPVESCHTE